MDAPLFPMIERETAAYNLELEGLFPNGQEGVRAMTARPAPFFPVRTLGPDEHFTLGQCAKIAKNSVLADSAQPAQLRALYEECRWAAKQAFRTPLELDARMKAAGEFLVRRLEKMESQEKTLLLPGLRQLLEIDQRITKLREIYFLGSRPQHVPMDVAVVPHLLQIVTDAIRTLR